MDDRYSNRNGSAALSLSAAFDAAWREVSARRDDCRSEVRASMIRDKLARRIVAMARSGVHDAEELRDDAVANWDR